MLERTAAGLESCHIQRVLSKPARASKRCRKLHTGFWQHGASAIELSSVWPGFAKPGAANLDDGDNPTAPLQTSLLASAFLLDFLYPRGTYSLLRKLYPALPGPQDGARPSPSSQRRIFTSSAATDDHDCNTTLLSRGEPVDAKTKRIQRFSSTRDLLVDDSTANIDDTNSIPPITGGLPRTRGKASLNLLSDLLSSPEKNRHPEVWDLYCRLDEPKKQSLRPAIVEYLSTSRSVADIGRAVSLFKQTSMESWDGRLQAAGVLVLLRSGDHAAAIDVFKRGIESNSSVAGLEYLLHDSIEKRQWATVLKIWFQYYACFANGDAITAPEALDLTRVAAIGDLAQRYFSFERYLEVEAAGPVKAMNLHSISRDGLRSLRRTLAELALAQPCAPKRASIVLQIWNDTTLYETYLCSMLTRWQHGMESRANLTQLPEIYRNFRALDGAEASVSLLRGMFNLFYPADREGLGQVYLDWHQAFGDLDQWGYEKFLKFYAATGDVQAVKDLWQRYANQFPEVLTEPRAFKSIMQVYAQVGDAARAEEELRVMTEKYGVEPDIDIWNALLKCYTKNGDQSRALECFEEIKKFEQPNSNTYGQLMAMSAKRGDLQSTLDFFDQSQIDNMPLTREMALPLVMGYCKNDRLLDAQKICIEFADRDATSTAVWNQLLLFNGMQGKLNKCYEILKAMKSYDLEWDHQTHEFLLQALIRVDQIQPAYRLLRNAHDDRLFPVGADHYAVVMSGAVRTGQLDLAQTLLTHMRSLGYSVPFNVHVTLVEAAYRRNPSASRTRFLAKQLVAHLRSMLPTKNDKQMPADNDAELPTWTVTGGLVDVKKQTRDIGRAIMLLVELREFTTVEELVNSYAEVFPEIKSRKVFPPDIASALMLGYLKDGKLDQVREMWARTLDDVLGSCRSQQGIVYPANQYDLARPLNVIVKAFREANDGQNLLDCVEGLIKSGFKLTRTNWNLVVRCLAEMGHWERAMDWCEQMLMSRWRGWTHDAKSLQERRDMKNTRVLLASKATVFALQKEWLKLRKLAAWSAEVSAKLADIEHRHPRLHQAFITTDYEHLPATWVLPKKKSLTKAINEMLKPLSHDELKSMSKALEKQLRMVRQQKTKQNKSRRVLSSPFHVVTGRTLSKNVVTKAFNPGDLKHLDVALRNKLSERSDNRLEL